MMNIITSKDTQKVKFAAPLKLKKNRENSNLFLCEGSKNLEMAIKANCVQIIFTKSELKLPESCGAEIYKVNDEIIDKLSVEKNPEGIVFVCKKIEYKKDSKLYNKIVYLDEVSDPGNLGTIIRTALALKYDAVILSKNCVDIYNEKTIAASKGSIFFLPVFYGNLEDYKDKVIYVSSLSNRSIDLNRVQKNTNFVLVLGNESRGVSQNILAIADKRVRIDIENIESLNVAVAGAIAMYRLGNVNE